MTTATAGGSVGPLLREWRQRRRLSQLALASAAEVSARHLSFIETGRAKPSRELVLHLAERLDVPLRDRNPLLLAAGYAPSYQETPLEAEEMEPVRRAVDTVVRGHEPYPAIVVDRVWDLVTANDPALRILTADTSPELLRPRPNALRVALHPEGLARRIENFEEWAAHLLERLDRQIAASDAPDLVELAAELRSYPNVPQAAGSSPTAERLFVPLALHHDGQVMRFVSTITTFGTALDITVAELSIESFFPADEETAAALRG